MFDIGFSELLVIAIVALVVLGPERLPRVARTAGHLIGRFQRYANQVKSDISREMQLEDMKKMQAEMQDTINKLQSSVSSEVSSLQASVTEATEGVKTEVEKAGQSVSVALSIEEVQRAADTAQSEAAQLQAELARSLAPAADAATVTSEGASPPLPGVAAASAATAPAGTSPKA